MDRRIFLFATAGSVVGGEKLMAQESAFPPVPTWRPSFQQPRDQIVDRMRYYTDGQRDFAVFEYGTCVILPNGLPEQRAHAAALETLHKIFHAHPDMTPRPMDDGNILISYREPAVNVVLESVAQAHWPEIEARHLDGLAPDEVLMTPAGANKFDDFGKKAILGRCYMFMDAPKGREHRAVDRHCSLANERALPSFRSSRHTPGPRSPAKAGVPSAVVPKPSG